MTKRSLRIGVTGPIACGKSTVSAWLAGDDGVVVDADAISHAVTAPGGQGLDAVVARFGENMRRADGSLDRAALGRIVFSDPVALRDLEAIVHPAVRPRIVAAVADAEAAGARIVVVEAIKLVEAGYAAQCDEVWLVTCDRDAQRERLSGRGLTRIDVDTRIAAQGDIAERLRPAATRIVDTSGPKAVTRARVAALRVAAIEQYQHGA